MAVIGSDSNNYVFGLVQASSEPSQSSSWGFQLPSDVRGLVTGQLMDLLQLSDEWILEFAKTVKAYLEEVK